jgi:hypothetical protein
MSTTINAQLACGAAVDWYGAVVAEVTAPLALQCGICLGQSELEAGMALGCAVDTRTDVRAELALSASAHTQWAMKGQVQAELAFAAATESFARDPSLARLELYHALDDGIIDYATPDEVFTTLPHTTTKTYQVDGKHRYVVRRRNAYNMIDSGRREHVIWVRNTEYCWPGPPSRPLDCQILQYTDTFARYLCKYYPMVDPANRRATHFALWYTTDGSGKPAGDPQYTEQMGSIVEGAVILNKAVTAPPLEDETLVRGWFAARYYDSAEESWIDSDVVEAPSLTIDAQVPPAPILQGLSHLRHGGTS